jgi:hypothetical protein
MSKSSKHKQKKGQPKPQRQPKPEQPAALQEQPALPEQSEQPTADTQAETVTAEAPADDATQPTLTVPEKSPAAELRAALQAKQQQQRANQWKQQVKAGKMVSAHVPKRFNRGG